MRIPNSAAAAWHDLRGDDLKAAAALVAAHTALAADAPTPTSTEPEAKRPQPDAA